MFLWKYFHWFHRHSPLNKGNWKLNGAVWQLPLLVTVSPTLNIMHYSSFWTPCTCILNLPKDEVNTSVCTASNDKMMIQNWKWRVRKQPRPNLLFRRVSAGTKEKPVRIAGASAWMKTRHLPYSNLNRHRYTKLLVLTLLLRRHCVIILWLGEKKETSLFANWVNESIVTRTPTHIGCNPRCALPWRRGWVSGGEGVLLKLCNYFRRTRWAPDRICASLRRRHELYSYEVAVSASSYITSGHHHCSVAQMIADDTHWRRLFAMI